MAVPVEEPCPLCAQDALLEQLAALEHDRWSRWHRHVRACGTWLPTDHLLLQGRMVDRWDLLAETPYAQLSEELKEKDRVEVRRTLAVLKGREKE